MGRTDNPAPMEGVSYPRRSSKEASLRRMQSEAHISGSRSTAPLGPPRQRDLSRSREPSSSSFWNTVMDRPAPSLGASSSFHGGFPSGAGSSSSLLQPTQSFHGTTAGSSSRGSSSRSSQKRYQCQDCGASYATSRELSEHSADKHARPPRRFQCECGVFFSQKSHLNQHVKTVHRKERPHVCSQCDKAFGKKYDLVSHTNAVHFSNRPHTCRFCDRKFAKRSNLTRHTEKLHPEESNNR